MGTKPNIMITLVISAAVSVLILANSAPAQAGSHHGMTNGGNHPNSQQGMISNTPSLTKSSMYDVKINTGHSSSGSGKLGQVKSLTTKKNDAIRTKLGLGKGSTVTNSQLTPFAPQATKFIQKQAIFGNQPYTHPRETTGTGTGSDTGTGAATNSGSGKTGSDVTTANAGNSRAQSTVVTPPSPFPVSENRKPLNPAEGSAVTDSGTTITSSDGSPDSPATRPFLNNPQTGEGPENWASLSSCPSGANSDAGKYLVWVPATQDRPAHWQCINIEDVEAFPDGGGLYDELYNMPNWPDNFWIPPMCPNCPWIEYTHDPSSGNFVVVEWFPDGELVVETCFLGGDEGWYCVPGLPGLNWGS